MSQRSAVATRTGCGHLGQVLLAGRIVGGTGLAANTTRRHGSWGLTFLRAGSGRYRDANHDEPIGPGTLVIVFPGWPHWYGATPGSWDENFVVFEGPVFDLALARGAMRPSQPLVHDLPVGLWQARLDAFRTRRRPATPSEHDVEVLELLGLLTEAVAARRLSGDAPERDSWFERSVELLESHLGEPLDLADVAAEVGMPYETWRRRFRSRAGHSPYHHRAEHRLRTATDLVIHTDLSTRDIAAATGFSDERHLIRRFRAEHGLTPRRVRDASR